MTKSTPGHVALFGGSFNPPHLSHIMATLWVLQTQPIDEVWWIPTYQHAFDKKLASFDDRLDMCQAALQDLRRTKISTIERRMGGESRTIDTVKLLMDENPGVEFSLVVGADILDEVHRWKNWDGLMDLVGLIVVGRHGYDPRRPQAGEALELPDISSTTIRDALQTCDYDRIRDWIPRQVLEIISSRKLYLGPICR